MTIFSKEARERRGEWVTRSWKHRTVFFALCLVFGLLLGSLYMVATGGKVFGAEPKEAQAVSCDSYGSVDCSRVKKVHRIVNRRLHNGKQARPKASFDMRDAFTKPKKSKRIVVRKIKVALAASAGSTSARCCSSEYARHIYMQIVDTPSCGFVGTEDQLSDIGRKSWCRVLNTPERRRAKLNPAEVRDRLGLIVCSAGSAVAVVGAIGTGGTAAIGAGITVSACSLTMWESIERTMTNDY